MSNKPEVILSAINNAFQNAPIPYHSMINVSVVALRGKLLCGVYVFSEYLVSTRVTTKTMDMILTKGTKWLLVTFY